MKFFAFVTYIWLLPLFITSAYAQDQYSMLKDAYEYIDENNTNQLRELIKNGFDVNYSQEKKHTALAYAVLLNKTLCVRTLLDNNADPNLFSKGNSPLMWAARHNYSKSGQLLVQNGAYIDSQNQKGRTALIIASQFGNLEMVKVLVTSGANLMLTDIKYRTALDIAQSNVRNDVITFLESKFSTLYVPEYIDGPYVFRKNEEELEAFYLFRDSLRNFSTQNFQTYKYVNDTAVVKDFLVTQSRFPIPKKHFAPEKYEFKTNNDILAIGDIHGQFDRIHEYLISNQVIDTNLNWTFGENHLVFLGDIMDRGNQVTEMLWLVYKLEQEAIKAGGKVHIIFGNHEQMVLQGDHRYVSDKYRFLFNSLKLDFDEFYGKKSVLGEWLRSKNSFLKINDYMFVHAGISQAFVDSKIPLDSANLIIRNSLWPKFKFGLDPKADLVLSEEGPIWYRGFFSRNMIKNGAAHVDNILANYGVRHIVVGHTEVETVTLLLAGRIFATNIPLAMSNIPVHALLISKNKAYKLYSHGRKVLLPNEYYLRKDSLSQTKQ